MYGKTYGKDSESASTELDFFGSAGKSVWESLLEQNAMAAGVLIFIASVQPVHLDFFSFPLRIKLLRHMIQEDQAPHMKGQFFNKYWRSLWLSN